MSGKVLAKVADKLPSDSVSAWIVRAIFGATLGLLVSMALGFQNHIEKEIDSIETKIGEHVESPGHTETRTQLKILVEEVREIKSDVKSLIRRPYPQEN